MFLWDFKYFYIKKSSQINIKNDLKKIYNLRKLQSEKNHFCDLLGKCVKKAKEGTGYNIDTRYIYRKYFSDKKR